MGEKPPVPQRFLLSREHKLTLVLNGATQEVCKTGNTQNELFQSALWETIGHKLSDNLKRVEGRKIDIEIYLQNNKLLIMP